MFSDFFRKHKINKLKRKIKTERKNRRKYLVKLLDAIPVDELLPEKHKYVIITPLYDNINYYVNHLEELFVNYNYKSPMPRTLLNKEPVKMYYLDFFINNNKLINTRYSLIRFINLFKDLTDMVAYYDIHGDGVSFLNFKIINFYLTNMEEVIMDVLELN